MDTIFFQFEIIINVLVSSFCLIGIPVLCVYGHLEYVYSYGAWIDFRRQILTSKVDSRSVRVRGDTTSAGRIYQAKCGLQ